MQTAWKQGVVFPFALCVLALCLAGGCGTGPQQNGHKGDVYVMVVRSADVTSIDLTGFGVPANPLDFTTYGVHQSNSAVGWTSGVSYSANVALEPDPGEEADCGDNPYDMFPTCSNGKDGDTRTYLLEFSGDQILKSLLIGHQTG